MSLTVSSPIILHIETASPICSVSIASGKDLLAAVEAENVNNHAKMLAPMIKQALDKITLSVKDLNAVAISEGPGSYTGLRIGFATAKGICYAANLPLITVNTLQAMTFAMRRNTSATENCMFLPVLDARRNDVYWQLFNQHHHEENQVGCNSVDDVIAYIRENKINTITAGTGAFKLAHFANEVTVIPAIVIASANMLLPALEKFQSRQFADLAYSEPYYRQQ